MYCELYYSFEGREIKMIITEPDCWIPVGRSKDKKGYIWFWFRGKTTRLHRAIYILLHGELPSYIHVRHVCDNSTCCNPAHLMEGTVQDNADDRKRHGHQLFGEQIHTAKLTEAMVETILNSNSTQKELAIEYSVSQPVISRIINGKTWKHIRRPTNWVPKRSKLARMPDKSSIKNSQPKTKSIKKEEKE